MDSATHWSRLLADGGAGTEAWRYFYTRYRGAVAALFRRSGLPAGLRADEVDDLVHTFFLDAFRKGLLEGADPERGRFRAFLKTAAKHFLISQKRRAGAQKRLPEGGVAQLDAVAEPVDPGSDPEQAFDLAWAKAALEAATKRALAEASEADRQLYALRTGQSLSWEEVCARTGQPESTARRRHRQLRDRVSECLREEIALTVGEALVEAELSDLREILG